MMFDRQLGQCNPALVLQQHDCPSLPVNTHLEALRGRWWSTSSYPGVVLTAAHLSRPAQHDAENPKDAAENTHNGYGQADSVWQVGARQRADLAELADWLEGIHAAAQKAREDGNPTLADALDITRFEVYERYLDDELHQQSQPSR